MNDKQYTTVLKLFADLNGYVGRLDSRMNDLEDKLSKGFTRQEAISVEILGALGNSVVALEKGTQKTNQANNRRFLKLERHVGLAK